MHLSIVTGTYNRKASLERMISSAVKTIPPGIDFEFVVVDGGSTDGTLDMLQDAENIRVIEHGELLGAIRAFTDGAITARGQYVLLANDDIEFHPRAIMAAIAHLDTTPKCGAVAFADNRPHANTPPGSYTVQRHAVLDADGQLTSHPYAQVGLFRRWLGDYCGWWGAYDEMKDARTYGGDNYLSARIYECGYTVDAVPLARVADYVEADGLRDINYSTGSNDSTIYRKHFNPAIGRPRFNSKPVDSAYNQDVDALRILYAPIISQTQILQRENKRGLRDALKALGMVYEYDYRTRHTQTVDINDELINVVRLWRPDVILMQIHQMDGLVPDTFAQIRREYPDVLMLNWNGDVWPDAYLAEDVIQALQYFDVALGVNDSMRDEYAKHGIKWHYWQIASEAVTNPDMTMPKHDVVFLGNCYDESRVQLGQTLDALRDKYNVGIYGGGWEQNAGVKSNGNTNHDYERTHGLIANAKIVIGNNQFPDARGFVSNRIFETLYAGGFFLSMELNAVDELTGITPNKHYAEYDTLEDLPTAIAYWLENDAERIAIAKRGKRYVRRYHTFDKRVEELFTKILPKVLT